MNSDTGSVYDLLKYILYKFIFHKICLLFSQTLILLNITLNKIGSPQKADPLDHN